MTGGRALGLLLAALLVVAGGLTTYQGLGLAGGGGESSAAIWGPLLAGLGVALAISVVGSARR